MPDTESNVTTTEFAVIVCKAQIQQPIATTWAKIGGFTDAGKFLNVPCELVSNVRGIGSVRKVGDSILEVMVGETEFSYSYAQIVGPMARFAYHGCVSLSAEGAGVCSLTYSITYDQTKLDESEKRNQSDRISQRFQGAVHAMKLEAEGNGS